MLVMSISILLQAMSAPGAFAAIPFPPDAPMPEWGVADPRSRTISQGRGARASEPVARARVLEALFADSSVDIYDLRVREGKDGQGYRIRSVTQGDVTRAEEIVRELDRENLGLVEPFGNDGICRLPRGEVEIVHCARVRILSEPGAFVDRLKLSFDESSATLEMSGRAYHLEARRAAEKAVRAIPGIRRVVDRLDAAPAVPRDDARILRELRQRLSLRGDLAQGGYQIEIVKGVAHLSGTVASVRERRLLRSLAEQVRGVIEVREEFTGSPNAPGELDLNPN